MLKIERKSKKEGFGITLNKKGRLLTPAFLWGFGIAFTIHVLGLAIFEVAPIKLRSGESILNPVQVKIEFLPLVDGGVLAELENKEYKTRFPEPDKGFPQLPIPPLIAITRKLALPKIEKLDQFPFEAYFHSYFPDFFNSAPASITNGPQIHVKLCGRLADKEYSFAGLESETITRLMTEEANGKLNFVSYQVKIDERSGKIFWYKKISGDEKRKLRDLSEKLLSHLQFQKNKEGFISDGEVEIEFLVEDKEL